MPTEAAMRVMPEVPSGLSIAAVSVIVFVMSRETGLMQSQASALASGFSLLRKFFLSERLSFMPSAAFTSSCCQQTCCHAAAVSGDLGVVAVVVVAVVVVVVVVVVLAVAVAQYRSSTVAQ